MNIDIKFAIDPDEDTNDYREIYSADVLLPDGTGFTVSATEDDVSYDQFRSDIFEDLFRSLADAAGITVNIDEEDYASVDIEDIGDINDYLADLEADRCGC